MATYAKKSVTLGHGRPQDSAQLPSSDADAASTMSSSMAEQQATHPMAQETALQGAISYAGVEPEPEPAHNHENVQGMGGSSILSGPSKEEKNEEEAAVSAIASEKQLPKKMVSINETVEEVAASRKKNKKKRSEKMGSFDQEIEEPKPLKSILKVGSKLNENSYMNPTGYMGFS